MATLDYQYNQKKGEGSTSSSDESEIHLVGSDSQLNLKEMLMELMYKLDTEPNLNEQRKLKKLIRNISSHTFLNQLADKKEATRYSSDESLSNAKNVRLYHFVADDMDTEPDITEDEKSEAETNGSIEYKEEQNTQEANKQHRNLQHYFKLLNPNQIMDDVAEEEEESEEANSPRPLQTNPEEVETWMNYKQEFKERCNGISLYQTNLVKKPWELVGRMADTLVDEGILAVLSEIDNEELLKKLYQNEMISELF